MIEEIKEALALEKKLATSLNASGQKEGMAGRYLKGGYGPNDDPEIKEGPDGYGVPEGAAIDGSHTFEGSQGYYAPGGKEKFLKDIANMKRLYQDRAIKALIKPGIGGQHTPFQGIAGMFSVDGSQITGEYELGKDFDKAIEDILSRVDAGLRNLGLDPSSKSGSTDETMMIFVDIFAFFLEKLADEQGVDGAAFAEVILHTLHDINFTGGKEIKGKDLFKGFSLDLIVDKAHQAGINIEKEKVKHIFETALGNMVFETTPRADQSRLAAFIFNSGLDKELKKLPAFVEMFDNVGGRWTADLHMMTFLAYYDLDAESYWNYRKKGIEKVRKGEHDGNTIGNMIVDRGITDIALVVPDDAFWAGKSEEQNFNESIWQDGFTNLVSIKAKHWEAQKANYDKENHPTRLVINVSGLKMSSDEFNLFNKQIAGFKKASTKKQMDDLSLAFAEFFTTFYGMTNTVANRLIVRALHRTGYTAADVDLNDLDNPATKVVQANLFLRQPFVELGKGLLEGMFKELQAKQAEWEGKSPETRAALSPVKKSEEEIKAAAGKGAFRTNIESFKELKNIANLQALADMILKGVTYAKNTERKFIPFIYLEGEKFQELRDFLTELGVEWVMQGTSDQHISYQQVLAQPQKYLPFIISMVPETFITGRPAIGFAKGYLHYISPNMVRDYFALASYEALTVKRARAGGQGFFLRLIDSKANIQGFKNAAKNAETNLR